MNSLSKTLVLSALISDYVDAWAARHENPSSVTLAGISSEYSKIVERVNEFAGFSDETQKLVYKLGCAANDFTRAYSKNAPEMTPEKKESYAFKFDHAFDALINHATRGNQ